MKTKNEHKANQSTLLFKVAKPNVLDTPKGYFDNLPVQLLEISNEDTAKNTGVKRLFIFASAVAAILIFGLILFNTPKTNKEVVTFNKSFNELTSTHLEEELFKSTQNLPIDFGDEKELDALLTELE